MDHFKLVSEYKPTGDQPQAIEQLVKGFKEGNQFETLLGVTGSGKTFTMANVIEQLNRPTLIIAHNKTLAAQLYSEMKEFFPENAVEYFVSYYDYYQPEAYVPSTDTYIEKDSSINDEIDKLRHSATAALSERRDVVIVASVSCIYGLGSPIDYQNMVISLRPGMEKDRDDVIKKLIEIQYDRNDMDFKRGTFRVKGDVVDIFPAYSDSEAYRIEFFGDEVDRIMEIDTVTGEIKAQLGHVAIFPASHYVVPKEKMLEATEHILEELKERVAYFKSEDKLLEAQRISERTNFDVEMMRESYNQRRRYLLNAFKEMGIDCFEPLGAFYTFPNISRFGMTSEEFATALLKEEKVAVVPGTAFGDCGEGYLRVSYAYSLKSLKEALGRIERFVKNHDGKA